jgi:hypothetical protein
MFKFHDGNHSEMRGHTVISGSDGFTAADLLALGEVQAMAMARQLWGRGQLIANEFAHYLAVWSLAAGAAEPPMLALARFRKTGTYMLMIGTTIVASGRRLSDVLPALSGAAARGNDPAAATNAAD